MRRHTFKAIHVATLLLFFAILPAVAGAHGGNDDPQVIHACVGNVSKAVRIVGVDGSCATRPASQAETPMHWAIAGPKGDKGDKGDQDDQGALGAQGPQGPQGDPGPAGAAVPAAPPPPYDPGGGGFHLEIEGAGSIPLLSFAGCFLLTVAFGAVPAMAQSTAAVPTFQAYSKFDFVPGEKIVGLDDFSQDSVGDFPAKWNTNAAGEIVTLTGRPGRWLKLTRGGVFIPELAPALPDNFTLEFDLLVPPAFNSGYLLNASLVALSDVNQPAAWQSADNRFTFTAFPGGNGGAWQTSMEPRLSGVGVAAVSTETKQLGKTGTPVHVAVSRHGPRVRVYFNEEKMWDVPRALLPAAKYNAILFFIPNVDAGSEYLLSNVRLAVGAPDTRNKLLTEGKWVTHGILFDVNSDRIRAESYGSLKAIAGVLAENAALKVQIVGHTDADGDEAANLDLSARRAASVKSALVDEFKIDAGRMDTDGKGEMQPIDKNDNPAGKANNRRVEFIRKER